MSKVLTGNICNSRIRRPENWPEVGLLPDGDCAEKIPMDVKSAVNLILPIQVHKTNPVERTIKSNETTDRDANGQQHQGKSEDNTPLTETEFERALAHLKTLSVVKDHGLEVSIEEKNGWRFILLSEPQPSGKLIRRIHELELRTLQIPMEGQPQKGQLLRKSA